MPPTVLEVLELGPLDPGSVPKSFLARLMGRSRGAAILPSRGIQDSAFPFVTSKLETEEVFHLLLGMRLVHRSCYSNGISHAGWLQQSKYAVPSGGSDTALDLARVRDLCSQASVAKIKTVLKMLLKQAIRHPNLPRLCRYCSFCCRQSNAAAFASPHVHGKADKVGFGRAQPAVPINQMILE